MSDSRETNVASKTPPAAPQLVCWKVWGGNGHTEVPVAIPGLRGELYSRPCDSDRGGDLYYLSACGSGALARLCVADVTGHGESVATFSGWLEEVFSKHIHRASPAGVLQEVNRRAARRGLELMSTAVCLSYNSLNGRLAFCSAGHPPVRLCRAGQQVWEPLPVQSDTGDHIYDLPLAVEADVRYTLTKLRLAPGDRLLIHTDGLTEALDREGRQLGGHLWEAGQIPGCDVPVSEVMAGIQAAVRAHTAGMTGSEDDITFMVLEAQPYQPHSRYTLFVKNNFHRLSDALRGTNT